MLKKTLLTVAALLVLVTLTVLAVRHYHQYQTTKTHQSQTATQQAVDQLAAERQAAASREAQLTSAYNAAVVECQKGVTAYAQLPQTVKVKVPAPSCPQLLR